MLFLRAIHLPFSFSLQVALKSSTLCSLSSSLQFSFPSLEDEISSFKKCFNCAAVWLEEEEKERARGEMNTLRSTS